MKRFKSPELIFIIIFSIICLLSLLFKSFYSFKIGIPILILMYILYINGIASSSFSIGLYYMGSFKNLGRYNKQYELSFDCSSLFIQKIISFKEDKYYNYNFNLNSSVNGEFFEIAIFDKKNCVLKLDNKNKIEQFKPIPKKRYYLCIKVKKSSGYFNLNWK